MQTELQIEFFLDDGHQHIDGDGGPDLRPDRILRGPIERLDAQMLLDPAKEQLDFPTALIELSNRQSGKKKVVGEKHETFLTLPIEVPYAPQSFGIAALGNGIVEHDDLIALQTRLLVDGLGIHSPAVEAFFRPRHKERSRLMHAVESFEIEIASVHQVNRSGLPDQLIEDVDLVDLPTGDDHHCGNAAAQIEQRVELDSGLAAAELRPGEERQTQIDRRGIEGVDRMVEFEAKGFSLVESPSFLDQGLGEVGKDAPVAYLVGVGQSVARDGAVNAHVIELLRCRSQASFDISETFSKRKLSKG